MPTGPKHQRFIVTNHDEGLASGFLEDCRCTIGMDRDRGAASDEVDDCWFCSDKEGLSYCPECHRSQ